MHIWCSVILCLMVSARYVDCGTVDTTSFSCNTGYSSDAADCQADGICSSYTCTLKDCGPVSAPADGTTTLASAGVTTYGATASVTCDEGFGLSTGTATATITCQADSNWSALPTCTGDEANCGDPSPPANGVISTAATANTEGHKATVACRAGYKLGGASTMTCQNDGTWSSPGTCSGSTVVAWSFYVMFLLGVITRLMKE